MSSKSDKNKSGFLSSFTSRSTKRHSQYSTNGKKDRPNSTNENEKDEDQRMRELEAKINRYNTDQVNEAFKRFLADTNIPREKQGPLLQKTTEERRQMVLFHERCKEGTEKSKFEKPHDYIEYLRESDRSSTKILQCMESLRVALTNNPISWIQEFGNAGIDEIVNVLRDSKRRRDADKIEYECVRCLKAVLNNTWGLNAILTPEQHAAVFLLAQCLDPKKPQIMCMAVSLLGGFCLIGERDGYRKVLAAITQQAKSSSDKNSERFRPIVEALFVDHEMEEKGFKTETKGELRTSCLILINTIINTPENLNTRLHLRCEMMRAGLYDRLDLLAKIVEKDFLMGTEMGQKFDNHHKIFHSYREEDYEEFSARFDNVRLELDDVNDCFEIAKNLVAETPSEPYFLSILQHLLFIRDDFEHRVAYFKLIEEVISQIVLSKDGVDPNFNSPVLNFDPTLLTDELVEKNKAKDAKRAEEYEKKIEELQMAKQEAEAKAAHLEEKLKEIEATGVITKTNKLPQINIPPPPAMPGMPRPPPAPPGSLTNGPVPPPPPMPGMGAPPPPPMPGMGGPRPPPMPGMGGPPPPPMMGMMGMPRMPMMKQPEPLPYNLQPKKKWEVDGPMKRANWKAIVPHKMKESSFWVQVKEEELVKSKENKKILDELAAKFSSKPAKKTTERDSGDKTMTVKKTVTDLRVLDAKSAQNLSILLGGSLKHMPFEQIKTLLLRCDVEKLSASVLQQLHLYLPPADQLKKLQELKASREDLSNAELFAATIAEIKRLKNRLQSLTFKLNFEDLYNDVNPDLFVGIAACEEVKKNQKFAKILELILLLGNYMNSGSKNEAAYGFEISFLTKLSSTKDHENKQTLLHYIAEVVSTKFPECLDFYKDFEIIDKASRVSLDNVQKTMRQMKAQLSDLNKDLENNKVPQSADDRFIDVMGSFAEEAGARIQSLSQRQVNMEKKFLALADYFAFDPNKYTLEEFFTDLKTFKDAFVQAVNDNNKLKEEEEKLKRAQEAREKHQQEMQERKGKRTQALNHNVDIDGQEQTGVMDTLIAALETGSAFNNRERRKRAPRPAGAERRAQLSRSRSRTGITAASFSSRELLANELLAA